MAPFRKYEERKAALQTQLADQGAKRGAEQGAVFGLIKPTSNLFRDRHRAVPKIDVSNFNCVIAVDSGRGTVDVEGMTTYADLVDATLPHGVMPCVVPQLKSITIGGAIAGVGIESSSFKQGLVHETIAALDVLTGDGRVLTCAPDNAQRDLFFGFPNSYGTLGYALKVTARTMPIRPFVAVEHIRFHDAPSCFEAIARYCGEADIDFLDGTIFAADEIYLSLARFVDFVPYTSDYTFENIYYRSIRSRQVDYLTVRDYIWRWDTDWFWCSKQVGAQHPLLRRLLGKTRLNSTTYQKIMRWNTRWGMTRTWNQVMGKHVESVIQDVDIPLDNAAEYFDFMLREIPILPIWLCPIHAPRPEVEYPLYPMTRGTPYVNFGFWDVIRVPKKQPPGIFNRKIELEVTRLGGIKSLYSDSYYGREEFWGIYGGNAYNALKQKYDRTLTRGSLYEKASRADKEM